MKRSQHVKGRGYSEYRSRTRTVIQHTLILTLTLSPTTNSYQIINLILTLKSLIHIILVFLDEICIHFAQMPTDVYTSSRKSTAPQCKSVLNELVPAKIWT